MRAECERRRRAEAPRVRPPQNAPRRDASRATRVKGVYPLWRIGRSVAALSVPDMDASDRVGGRVGRGRVGR